MFFDFFPELANEDTQVLSLILVGLAPNFLKHPSCQALLGHRMPGMTVTYSHGGPEWEANLRDALKRLEKATRWPIVWPMDHHRLQPQQR